MTLLFVVLQLSLPELRFLSSSTFASNSYNKVYGLKEIQSLKQISHIPNTHCSSLSLTVAFLESSVVPDKKNLKDENLNCFSDLAQFKGINDYVITGN